MQISAYIRNNPDGHEVQLRTAGAIQRLAVSAKASGPGSAANGGELLMAALATCYCNDLYREAARLGIPISGCEVVASAQFNGVGLGAESVVYSARVDSSAPREQVDLLLVETDRRAEVHNTLRAGCAVQRVAWRGPRAEGIDASAIADAATRDGTNQPTDGPHASSVTRDATGEGPHA